MRMIPYNLRIFLFRFITLSVHSFVFYTKHMENTGVKRWDHDVPLLLAPEIKLDKMDQSNWMYKF